MSARIFCLEDMKLVKQVYLFALANEYSDYDGYVFYTKSYMITDVTNL